MWITSKWSCIKKEKTAHPVCSFQASHYTRPRITHSTFIFLGCLILKVRFYRATEAGHIPQQWGKAGGKRGSQGSTALPPAQPTLRGLGSVTTHWSSESGGSWASLGMKHHMPPRSSVQTVVCGERCCHLKASRISIYISLTISQFPAPTTDYTWKQVTLSKQRLELDKQGWCLKLYKSWFLNG